MADVFARKSHDYRKMGPLLTATIVGSYLRHHVAGANQISDLITTVYQALDRLGQPVQVEKVVMPAVSVRRSVHHDYVVCLDCGFRALTLRRHLRVQHGLNPEEYMRRWNLKSDHPLTAPAYSGRRSTMAKALGLGRKATVETRVVAPMAVAAEPETQPTPTRKPRTRSGTKAAEVTSEAVAAPSPARRGRPRSRAGVASQP